MFEFSNCAKKIVQCFAVLLCACLLFVACNEEPAVTITPVDKNAPYWNSSLPVEDRVSDLLARMNIDEKVGQMTQLCRDVLGNGDIRQMMLGSVLSGGGSAPSDNSVAGWQNFIADCQAEALSTRLGIPMLYGIDSVHGQNTLLNATIFPHNIALGAAGDSKLVYDIAHAAAIETLATGIPWTFAPCVAVLRDPRWGRSYESFGEFTDPVTQLGAAFVEGWQSAVEAAVIPVACAKHYLGDGCTVYNESHTSGGMLDQGDMRETEEFVRTVLLPPYAAAVKSGVRTVMPSFSSWNGEKMHAHKYLLTDVLKGELNFTGFVISDWQAIDQIDADYYTAVVQCINAGVDMSMVPYDGNRFIMTVKDAVKKGDITMERIDDAVSRILRVKFESGLFEYPVVGSELAEKVRCKEHLELARKAVAQSVVVLKNENLLPLSKNEKTVYVMGYGADDIGVQCGGWTMTWQGMAGNITAGTTVFEGIKSVVNSSSQVIKLNANEIDTADESAVCIIVTGEQPYAEFKGDSSNLPLSDVAIISRASAHFKRVVLVTLSGRPVIITNESNKVQAVAAAWLPGTEGAGVADILFGNVKPSGKLPVDWPSSVSQLPYGNFISGKEVPLYSAGTGLTW